MLRQAFKYFDHDLTCFRFFMETISWSYKKTAFFHNFVTNKLSMQQNSIFIAYLYLTSSLNFYNDF